MSETIFKYSELKRFLKHAAGLAPVIPFREWEGGNAILLRHDIDLDIQPALEVAGIEKECGVRSTFMVMTTCPAYNSSSQKNRVMLRQMVEWGFEVGLHFDPNIYPEESPADLKRRLDFEAGILSDICGQKVQSVSLHNPSGYGSFPLFDGYINAYDPEIFGDEKYLSDSRMLFSGKNPFEFVKRAEAGPIQVVLHPDHYTRDGAGYPEIFFGIARRFIDDLDRWYRINSTYNEKMREHLFEYVMRVGNKVQESGKHMSGRLREKAGMA